MNRVEEINQRLQSRNIGDMPQFYFSPRPVNTKYTTMPIVDERIPDKVPIQCKPVFDTTVNFLPGTSAPWSGKIDQIDIETKLSRSNDFFPSSKGDLYHHSIPSKEYVQPFPFLFSSVKTKNNGIKQTFQEKQLFYNSTSNKNIY
jgi:hypothetical protein